MNNLKHLEGNDLDLSARVRAKTDFYGTSQRTEQHVLQDMPWYTSYILTVHLVPKYMQRNQRTCWQGMRFSNTAHRMAMRHAMTLKALLLCTEINSSPTLILPHRLALLPRLIRRT